MRALITGATGLVGRELCKHLTSPVVLTRSLADAKRLLGPSVQAFEWQPETSIAPAAALEGIDAVFHLAGEPVAEGRWTPEKKRRIRDSRVLGTKNLVAALRASATPPRVLVSVSAVGYYGDRGDEELGEGAPRGEGFLADVCEAWEAEARAAERPGMRVVVARLGLVLAERGGALERMLPPFRMGVGGKLGNGRQWMPWVHMDDVIGLLLHAAREHAAPEQRLSGPLNIASPKPVTNAEFTRTLGHALRRPAILSVPRVALRVAFGELSEALLSSQRVMPRAAQATGYGFVYSELAPALAACVRG